MVASPFVRATHPTSDKPRFSSQDVPPPRHKTPRPANRTIRPPPPRPRLPSRPPAAPRDGRATPWPLSAHPHAGISPMTSRYFPLQARPRPRVAPRPLGPPASPSREPHTPPGHIRLTGPSLTPRPWRPHLSPIRGQPHTRLAPTQASAAPLPATSPPDSPPNTPASPRSGPSRPHPATSPPRPATPHSGGLTPRPPTPQTRPHPSPGPHHQLAFTQAQRPATGPPTPQAATLHLSHALLLSAASGHLVGHPTLPAHPRHRPLTSPPGQSSSIPNPAAAEIPSRYPMARSDFGYRCTSSQKSFPCPGTLRCANSCTST